MPSVTFFLPWPTLSVAPLPPTLVLTPVLLRFILTPGRTLMVLRKRKYPMGLAPLIDRSGRSRRRPDSSATVRSLFATLCNVSIGRTRALSTVQIKEFTEPPDLVLDLADRGVSCLEPLVGGLPIQSLRVFLPIRGIPHDQGLPFLRAQRRHARHGWAHQGALHHGWLAPIVQNGNQRLSNLQLLDDTFGIELRVPAEGLGSGADGLLLLG